MSMSMILLLQAEAGAAEEVATAVRAIPAVVDTAITSGPYDVISQVDACDGEDERRVVDAVRQVQGLARLCLCRAVAR